jgi:hypothetical protein
LVPILSFRVLVGLQPSGSFMFRAKYSVFASVGAKSSS